jgi:hypothetical protein
MTAEITALAVGFGGREAGSDSRDLRHVHPQPALGSVLGAANGLRAPRARLQEGVDVMRCAQSIACMNARTPRPRADTAYWTRNVGLRRMTVRRGLLLRTSVIVIR